VTGPPRLAAWLLERLLDPRAAEAIGGDLHEQFLARATVYGRRRAARWYWRETWRAVLRSDHGIRPCDQTPRSDQRGRRPGQTLARLGGSMKQDLRFAFRTFRRAPGFALAATVTLAVGIGAATAIATSAEHALWRPLPFPAGDRLVHLGHPDDNKAGAIGNVGFLTILDWRARLSSLEEIAIIRGWNPTLVEAGGAERLDGLRVSWNFFRTLGIHPAIGRDFTADDDQPDRWRVVMLSHGLWQRRFGGRMDIAGQAIDFNGRRYQVAGVLPASFEPIISQHFYARAEIWAPLGYGASDSSACRSCQHLKTIGRLRTGVDVTRAQEEMSAVHVGMRQEHPADYVAAPPRINTLRDELTAPLRRPLQVLLGAVAFVLLVACANVAGLLVARASERQRELAVRSALGASRLRIVRQLVTESLVLAVASAALGIVLARWGLTALAEYAPGNAAGLEGLAADPWVFLIGAAITTTALIGFALIPAWSAARRDLQTVLRQGRQSPSRHTLRAREWLMVAQVAAALSLVAGAGLMVRTVGRLLQTDPGFNPHGVVTMGLSLVGPSWAEDSAVRVFQTELIRRVRGLAGVERAALAGQIPLGNNYDRWGFRIEGRTLASDAEAPSAERYSVSPDYFQTMGIPLKSGRLFGDEDKTDSPLVIIVGETAARSLWLGESPLGHRVRVGGNDGPWRTVVGIVGDVRHYQLDQPPTPQFYVPQTQMTDSYLILTLRASGDPSQLVRAVRREVAAVAPDVPIYDVKTLEGRVAQSVASRTFVMVLLGLFAIATVIMAAIGLYGVVSQSVTARRREFGIRLALGARGRDVASLVLARGSLLVGAGMVIGLAASAALGRLLGSQLYDTTPADPLAIGGAVATLVAAALAAHFLPLRRATRVDPTVTLRSD
jgi:putative ABC transport system permease protein